MSDRIVKGLGPVEIKNADRGEVEAVIATLGVIDRDGDIIRAGAIPSGAKVKLSSYRHDVMYGAIPVGKGVIDRVGNRLIFRGRVFLATPRGRETFEVLKEMGPDQEWSLGFLILKSESPTEAERRQGAVRVLTKLGALEVSPVLIGAGIGTQTLAVKAEDSDAEQAELAAIADAFELRAIQVRHEERMRAFPPPVPPPPAPPTKAAEPHTVPVAAQDVPLWMHDAADIGIKWIRRHIAPDLPPIRVSWFTGAYAEKAWGFTTRGSVDRISLSAGMKTWAQVVEVAAHEAAHCAGYRTEEVPYLLGLLAAKAWLGDLTVFVHWGEVPLRWVPEAVKAGGGFVPSNAVVVECNDGHVRTLRNVGSPQHPKWHHRAIPGLTDQHAA